MSHMRKLTFQTYGITETDMPDWLERVAEANLDPLPVPSPDTVAALGAAECAIRAREKIESDAAWAVDADRKLAPHGWRSPRRGEWPTQGGRAVQRTFSYWPCYIYVIPLPLVLPR